MTFLLSAAAVSFPLMTAVRIVLRLPLSAAAALRFPLRIVLRMAVRSAGAAPHRGATARAGRAGRRCRAARGWPPADGWLGWRRPGRRDADPPATRRSRRPAPAATRPPRGPGWGIMNVDLCSSSPRRCRAASRWPCRSWTTCCASTSPSASVVAAVSSAVSAAVTCVCSGERCVGAPRDGIEGFPGPRGVRCASGRAALTLPLPPGASGWYFSRLGYSH